MVNRLCGVKSLIAVIFVGMALSCAPVQADCDMKTAKNVVGVVWSKTKTISKYFFCRVPSAAFKWVKTAIKLGCIVGGSASVATALIGLRVKESIDIDHAELGIGLGAGSAILVLASWYLYQDFKSEKKDKKSDED